MNEYFSRRRKEGVIEGDRVKDREGEREREEKREREEGRGKGERWASWVLFPLAKPSSGHYPSVYGNTNYFI